MSKDIRGILDALRDALGPQTKYVIGAYTKAALISGFLEVVVAGLCLGALLCLGVWSLRQQTKWAGEWCGEPPAILVPILCGIGILFALLVVSHGIYCIGAHEAQGLHFFLKDLGSAVGGK